MGRLQAVEGEVRVGLVAVEEMLGVEDHFVGLYRRQGDAFSDHGDIFFWLDVEHHLDVEIPGLADHTHRLGAGGQKRRQAGVVVGAASGPARHSERRQDHNESDKDVRNKAKAAIAAGLVAVVCCGESDAEREAMNTLEIISGQLAGSIPDNVTGENLVVAYEPIWAIGTGKVPTLDQIGEVHDFIRTQLERRFGEGVGRSVRLLYGGSVKPSNAEEIFAVSNVDGALVGGASLKAADFSGIITALDNA